MTAVLTAGLLAVIVTGCEGLGDVRNEDPIYGVQPTPAGKLVGTGSGAATTPSATVASNSVPPIPSPNPGGTVQLTMGNQPPLDTHPDIRSLQISGPGAAGTPVSNGGGVTIRSPSAVGSPSATSVPAYVAPVAPAVPLASTPAISLASTPPAGSTFVATTAPGQVSPGPAPGPVTPQFAPAAPAQPVVTQPAPAPAPAWSGSSTGTTGAAGSATPSFDELNARLQALGMTTSSLRGSPSTGYTFTALVENKQKETITNYEATGPTAAAAMQAVIEKLQQAH